MNPKLKPKPNSQSEFFSDLVAFGVVLLVVFYVSLRSALPFVPEIVVKQSGPIHPASANRFFPTNQKPKAYEEVSQQWEWSDIFQSQSVESSSGSQREKFQKNNNAYQENQSEKEEIVQTDSQDTYTFEQVQQFLLDALKNSATHKNPNRNSAIFVDESVTGQESSFLASPPLIEAKKHKKKGLQDPSDNRSPFASFDSDEESIERSEEWSFLARPAPSSPKPSSPSNTEGLYYANAELPGNCHKFTSGNLQNLVEKLFLELQARG